MEATPHTTGNASNTGEQHQSKWWRHCIGAMMDVSRHAVASYFHHHQDRTHLVVLAVSPSRQHETTTHSRHTAATARGLEAPPASHTHMDLAGQLPPGRARPLPAAQPRARDWPGCSQAAQPSCPDPSHLVWDGDDLEWWCARVLRILFYTFLYCVMTDTHTSQPHEPCWRRRYQHQPRAAVCTTAHLQGYLPAQGQAELAAQLQARRCTC